MVTALSPRLPHFRRPIKDAETGQTKEDTMRYCLDVYRVIPGRDYWPLINTIYGATADDCQREFDGRWPNGDDHYGSVHTIGPVEDPTSTAAALLGRRGGAAGRGDAKRRGDAAYYVKLARASAVARAAKRLAKLAPKAPPLREDAL